MNKLIPTDDYKAAYDTVMAAARNCNRNPKKYGSLEMFDFVYWTAVKLFRDNQEKQRVSARIFGRNKFSNYEDIGCVCMDHCRFYIINNRVGSRSPSFTYVKDVIIPRLHKRDKTSSKCIVMPIWSSEFKTNDHEMQNWMVRKIKDAHAYYKAELAKRSKRVN